MKWSKGFSLRPFRKPKLRTLIKGAMARWPCETSNDDARAGNVSLNASLLAESCSDINAN